jgi:hypothetical protein
MTLQPTGVAHIVDVARLRRGLVAGVALQPIRTGVVDVVAVRNDRHETTIRVRVRK